MKTVFICGTGRCGTTITKKVLAQHTHVFAFENEARFIDDPKGVVDLFLKLTTHWAPWYAERALWEFERLMLKKRSAVFTYLYKKLRKYQSNRRAFTLFAPPSYLSLDIHEHRLLVKRAMERLKQDLNLIRYPGCWHGILGGTRNPQIAFTADFNEDRIARALDRFLSTIVGELMSPDGACVWVDDSIYVHLQAPEVRKILPAAKFVHIIRDPRDVIASYQTKIWAPPSTIDGARMYNAIMTRWNQVKKKLPPESYLEVSFEWLMASPRQGFQRLCEFIGIPWDECLLNMDLNHAHVGRWQNDLTPEDLQRIQSLLPIQSKEERMVEASP